MKINISRKIVVIFLAFLMLGSVILFLKNENPRPQNIILITIDALRPDHLGCYGYERNTSPNIDKIAKEGVIFTQAITQSTFTPPSIFSTVTSTYPQVHGVYEFGMDMSPNLTTLPEILKRHGYYVALISGRGRLSEFHFPELEKKFDYFYPASGRFLFADKVTKNAIEWLRSNKHKKFFLWLYYLEPHPPYVPHPPYTQFFVNDGFRDKNDKIIQIADASKHPFYGYKAIPRIAAIKGITDAGYYISQYDGEIAFVDSQIKLLLEELKKQDPHNDTVIVIHSDHGESMGEHDFYFCHGHSLYDDLLKITLIIKYKGMGINKKIDRQVESIDIMPTILDIIGIENPKQSQGISLLPLIEQGKYDRKNVFSEISGQKSLRTEEWKLIHREKSGQYELYNLKQDPRESVNLINAEKKEAQLLKEELNRWAIKGARDFIPGKEHINDEETKRKLRYLGYVE